MLLLLSQVDFGHRVSLAAKDLLVSHLSPVYHFGTLRDRLLVHNLLVVYNEVSIALAERVASLVAELLKTAFLAFQSVL